MCHLYYHHSMKHIGQYWSQKTSKFVRNDYNTRQVRSQSTIIHQRRRHQQAASSDYKRVTERPIQLLGAEETFFFFSSAYLCQQYLPG